MDFPASMPQNWRMDYGPDFLSKGVITIQPPKLGPAYSVLVPQVDADGNDLGGIALPFLAVPLGTYTGWNYELPRLESLDYLAGLIGSFQPFSVTKEESGWPLATRGLQSKSGTQAAKIISLMLRLSC